MNQLSKLRMIIAMTALLGNNLAKAQQLKLYSGSASTTATGPNTSAQTARFYKKCEHLSYIQRLYTRNNCNIIDLQPAIPSSKYYSAPPGLTFEGALKGIGHSPTTMGEAPILNSLNWLGNPLSSYFTSSRNSATAGTNLSVSINYAYADDVGIKDSSPAIYTLSWENPLPVKLISFNVKTEGRTAALDWETATEVDNKGFAVERSADVRTWNQIGFVESKSTNGNSALKLGYSFAIR
ncbi:hypothetical protein [Dyadobacter sp. BHUBP1]|uniref:hypothetical protein n=1 Tax=Dyadobacter sp. BHUBP1 TaxID=3424178 RepID=UPI003D34D402